MARIFYLNIDTGASAVKIRATQLHTEFHQDGPTRLDRERFRELYREVATVPGDDPEAALEAFMTEVQPDQVDEDMRGMEVGDIVRIAEETYVYVPDGWQEIAVTN